MISCTRELSPVGVTSRPPTCNWFFSVASRSGALAATTMASNGASSGQPSLPSAFRARDVLVTELRDAGGRFSCQTFARLDGVYGPGQFGEQCRLVARSRADLEDLASAREAQGSRQNRNDVWLRQDLVGADRQWHIFVGELLRCLGHEGFSRNPCGAR